MGCVLQPVVKHMRQLRQVPYQPRRIRELSLCLVDEIGVDIDTDDSMTSLRQVTADAPLPTAGIQDSSVAWRHCIHQPRLAVNIAALAHESPPAVGVAAGMLRIGGDNFFPSAVIVGAIAHGHHYGAVGLFSIPPTSPARRD